MRCPFCLSDKLESFWEEEDRPLTHCCEDCGASFEIVQEPQPDLLEDAIEKNKF